MTQGNMFRVFTKELAHSSICYFLKWAIIAVQNSYRLDPIEFFPFTYDPKPIPSFIPTNLLGR